MPATFFRPPYVGDRGWLGIILATIDDDALRLYIETAWIYYAGGAGRSKLTPALLDRLVGSPVTARNWRTVVQLAELAGAEG